jgi:hypothetical protein
MVVDGYVIDESSSSIGFTFYDDGSFVATGYKYIIGTCATCTQGSAAPKRTTQILPPSARVLAERAATATAERVAAAVRAQATAVVPGPARTIATQTVIHAQTVASWIETPISASAIPAYIRAAIATQSVVASAQARTLRTETPTPETGEDGPRKIKAGNNDQYDSDVPGDLPVFKCHADSTAYDTIIYDRNNNAATEKRYRHFTTCETDGTTSDKGKVFTSCKVDTISETVMIDSLIQKPETNRNNDTTGYTPATIIQVPITVRSTRFVCGIDSISSRDSVISINRTITINDTIIDNDTCRVTEAIATNLQGSAAATFCWRGECSHERYTGVATRYNDSVSKYRQIELNARVNQAQAQTETKTALNSGDYILAEKLDSASRMWGRIANAAAATAGAYSKAASEHVARQHITSYVLDTLNFEVNATLPGGCTFIDTFMAVRIPLEYTIKPIDTTLQAERRVNVVAEAPNSTLEWDIAGIISKKHDPAVQNGDIRTAFGSNGRDGLANAITHANTTPAIAGISYGHDTTHGDTFYFPITITNTEAFDALYGRKASAARCAVTDTARVNYQYGFLLRGFVAYNGHWHPGSDPSAPAYIGWERTEADDVADPVNGYDYDLWTEYMGTENAQKMHLPVGNVIVYIYDTAGTFIDSAISDKNGYYNIKTPVAPGRYVVTAESPNKKLVLFGPEGTYLDGKDVSWLMSYSLSGKVKINNSHSMWVQGSDVNESRFTSNFLNGIDGYDAADLMSILLMNKTSFTTLRGDILSDWVYSTDTIEIASDTVWMVRGVMRGDANRNYNGEDQGSLSQIQKAAKQSYKSIALYGYIEAAEKENIISLPVVALDSSQVSSLQMAFPYSDDIEIIDVTAPYAEGIKFGYNAHYDENVLALIWATARVNACDIKVGDTLAIITLKVSGRLNRNPNRYFKNQTNFFQAAYGQKTIDMRIAVPAIEILYEYDYIDTAEWGRYDTLTKPGITDGGKETEIVARGKLNTSQILSVVPNPATVLADVTYIVEGNSVVTLQLYDMLGHLARTLVYSERQQGMYRRELNVSGLAAGVYFLRFEAISGNFNIYTDIKRIVVKK